MAEDTDFALLYRELGIDANCSLPELRHAYRRRVAKLHPDQGGHGEDVEKLQRLNRLYSEATDFYRRHSRLPGAMHAHAPLVQSAISSTEVSTWAQISNEQGSPPAGFDRISRYFVIVALVGIATLAWRTLNSGSSTNDLDAASTGMEAATPTPLKYVRTGMDKTDVLQLLGEPQAMHDLRWEYGPSWVEFRCSEVVDWYSSPKRPLKTETMHGLQQGHAPPDDQTCH